MVKMSLRVVAFIIACAYIQNAATQTKRIDRNRYGEHRPSCGSQEYRCRDGHCIPSVLHCNGRVDCPDNSDETRNECGRPGTIKCTTNQFRCDYGACVDGDAPCNGIKDCADSSDESVIRCGSGIRGSIGSIGIDEPPSCRGDQYTCDNGNCIGNSEICDGNADCSDGSDETSKICGSFNCPQNVFRCKYGGCIDPDLKCNGEMNCADNSDEDPQLCPSIVPLVHSSKTTGRPVPTRPTQRPDYTTKDPYKVEQSKPNQPTQRPSNNQWTQPTTQRPQVNQKLCPLPRQPDNGQYQLDESHCSDRYKCDVTLNAKGMPHGTILYYECNDGYRLNYTDPKAYCTALGTWSIEPVCEAITCPPLASAARSAECTTSTGNWISCDTTGVPSGSSAKLTCRSNYIQDPTDLKTRDDVKCNAKGEWEPKPINCVPKPISATTRRPTTRPYVEPTVEKKESHNVDESRPTTDPRPESTTPSDRISSGKNYCRLPAQPENGHWKLNDHHCKDEEDCEAPPGMTEIVQGSVLRYECNDGYRLNISDSRIYCISVGTWSVVPVCEAIRCPPLASVSRLVECTQPNGDWISCESTGVPPNSIAKVSCRNGYNKDTTDLTALEKIKCSSQGQWEPKPISCISVCGVASSNAGVPFIVNGSVATINEYPWHAILYGIKNNAKEFRCGASIIKDNMLITAAHCIYDETYKKYENPNDLYIGVGTSYRDFDFEGHPDTFRTAQVKKFYVPCNYYGNSGNYAMDIAILVIDKPIEFSALVMPICLDSTGANDQATLEIGNFGRVAGFGRTATAATSSILQSLVVPYVSQTACKAESAMENNERYFTADKFCAGYTNGSSVCTGDSGGGLVFKADGKWYLRGIVSVGIGAKKIDNQITCNSKSYTLFTRVSNHMDWIQKTIVKVETNKPHKNCV